MSTPSLTWTRTSSSTTVGGGVRGKDAGIARGTIIQVGATIETSHLFMHGYPQAGGITIGSIIGKGINGTINEYLTNKFNGTGGAGKMMGTGRSKNLGVSKVCNPERPLNHSTRRNNMETIKEKNRKTG